MGRIAATFEALKGRGEKALIPYVTAGDPDLETTERIIHALVANGADLIELGVPFSDPMADGPTIQAASIRALTSGTTLAGVLDLVRRVREHTNIPIILMGYYNPVFKFGLELFAREASEAGVDGVLLVDLPYEENAELRSFLQPAGIACITLLAPTSPPERRRKLAAEAEGFIYYVSMTGVTGSARVDPSVVAPEVSELRDHAVVPVAVGFGISSAEDAAAVARFADAVVVGSALVKIIEAYGHSPDMLEHVGEYVASLKAGIAQEVRR
ncbi:MAG TPA: tryptophan synthase subunit alpha [Desulfuromonadales bacterium]|nr:tryptophan synthase subunit alpha [Desulfuromonadales bacterium]